MESEKTQTEVTHMECKDSGEYAHKETTEYEQSEHFNSELVNVERGQEEYVHLKVSERALRKTSILAMNQHPRNGYRRLRQFY